MQASASDTIPPRSRRQQCLFAVLLLGLATAAVYAKVAGHDFAYYDDEHYVTTNPHVQQGLAWASVRWAFTSVGYADNWHPLTWLSHMLDVQMFGLEAGGHHLTSLALHVAATLLLFAFLSSATHRTWPSVVVSALFALHPLHVESVAWVAERKDVLSASLGFATLCAYVHYTRHPSVAKYLMVLALFALGLMAKPMLVTLPVLLLLVDYWPLERLRLDVPTLRRRVVEKLPLLALTVASALMTVIAQRRAIGSLERFGLLTRLSNAMVACCVYLGQAVWPADLSVLYPYPRPQLGRTLACLALLALLTTAVLRWGRSNKHLIFGWLWYLVSLIPVIGIVQVGSQPHADRYTYVPLVGVFVAVVWAGAAALAHASRSKRIVAHATGAVILVALAGATRRQIGYWKNGVTLYTRAFDVTQGHLGENAYYNFGNVLLEAGRGGEAVSYFEKALQINPNHARSHVSYGLILSGMGRDEDALGHYAKALQVDPNLAEAHNDLGTSLAKLGRGDEAAAHFTKALAIDPGYGDAHYNFGFLLAGLGRTDEAIVHYRKALELRPGDAGAHFSLALCLAQRGDLAEAVAHYRKAVDLDPNNTDALNNLGLLAARMGHLDEAVAYYRRALSRRPAAAAPLYNLAMTLARQGEWGTATSLVQSALAAARAAANQALVAAVQEVMKSLDQARASLESRGPR